MKKPKPGVSPNPIVTGGKTLPKLSGAVGGVPKAGMGGLLGVAPKMTAAPKRSTPTPPQVARAADMKARMSGTPKPPVRSVAKPAMVQPKPVIRSTAKPAMPSRKK